MVYVCPIMMVVDDSFFPYVGFIPHSEGILWRSPYPCISAVVTVFCHFQEQKQVEDPSREVKKVRKARNRRQEWNMMAYDKEFRPENRLTPSPYHGMSSEGSLSPDRSVGMHWINQSRNNYYILLYILLYIYYVKYGEMLITKCKCTKFAFCCHLPKCSKASMFLRGILRDLEI